jgi:hypothetical protein
MSRGSLDVVEVERRLGAELRCRADAMAVADEPFDPTRPARWPDLLPAGPLTAVAGPAGAGGGHRRRRAALVLAAAAAILAAAFLAVRLPAADGPGIRPGADQPSTTRHERTTVNTAQRVEGEIFPLQSGYLPFAGSDPVGPGLVPGWVPAEYELWSLTANNVDREPAEQTIGCAECGRDQHAVSVSFGVEPFRDSVAGVRQSGPGPVIRGRPSTASARLPIWQWEERGMLIELQIHGVTIDEAVAVLDGLTWRDDPTRGFAVPTTGRWRLADEQPPAPRATVDVTAVYGTGTGQRLYVRTTHADRRNRTQDPAPTEPDGSFVGRTVFSGVLRAWPDGRTVQIAGGPDDADIGLDTARQIAARLEPVSPDELRRRKADADARLAARPVVAHSDGDPAVTVARLPAPYGAAKGPLAICLSAAGARAACTVDDGALDWGIGTVRLADRPFLVLVVGPDAHPAVTLTRDDGAPPRTVHRTESDGWRFEVATIDRMANFDGFPGPGHEQFTTISGLGSDPTQGLQVFAPIL